MIKIAKGKQRVVTAMRRNMNYLEMCSKQLGAIVMSICGRRKKQ